MNRRIAQPNTPADLALRECVKGPGRGSFVMIAGAGSGKTTSLIKAIDTILSLHGNELRKKRQRAACITYTEIAAGEVSADIRGNPLVHVSTIHSFLWTIIKPFQNDIKEWVSRKIDARIAELRAEAAAFGPRVKSRTREKNQKDVERYEAMRGRIASVPSFNYAPGSDYVRGILGHDDIINMTSQLISERPLLRKIVAQQFPFIFVDESQDTLPVIVDALLAIQRDARSQMCLGFFGDPMQQIYTTGIGKFALPDGWTSIPKPENFRCPSKVLAVANAIRRTGDDLLQTRGRGVEFNGVFQSTPGTARMFILPADGNRDENIRLVRAWLAQQDNDPTWNTEDSEAIKFLVIVHRMAAKRLGFSDLYAALNDKAPNKFKLGFSDATAWPVRPFFAFILPLVHAMREGNELQAMNVLREQCPLLKRASLTRANAPELISRIRTATLRLAELMAPNSGATNRQVLNILKTEKLINLDPRWNAYLDETPTATVAVVKEDAEDSEETEREIAAMDAFLKCQADQFWSYLKYVEEQSPFSTQHGVKGAEFPKVIVVLDDEEGSYNQFSYGKYFGITEPSETDLENAAAGKPTTIERTRRLFYVCCTRALDGLAVVFFVPNVQAAKSKVLEASIFPDADVYTLDQLRK